MANQRNNRVHVFVSYSHKDKRWLDRLRVHLAPLNRDYDIDSWDDNRIKPGSKWRDEIRVAVDKANAAILIVSADFLASEFIHTNELPPLLKSAEEEGALILPIIASPSLFMRNRDLSQFQAVNNPSEPLSAASENEQEAVFLRVAEALLDRAEMLRTNPGDLSRDLNVPPTESFLVHRSWTRLIKIGDWIRDEEKSRIIGSGQGSYLLSRQEYGSIPFMIQAKLEFSNFEKPQNGNLGMNSGIILGWKEERGTNRYYNILMSGSEVLIERVGFKGGTETTDYEHVTDPIRFHIESGKVYNFKIIVGMDKLLVTIDEDLVFSLERPTGMVGRVGLRPWRSKLDCLEFIVDTEV